MNYTPTRNWHSLKCIQTIDASTTTEPCSQTICTILHFTVVKGTQISTSDRASPRSKCATPCPLKDLSEAQLKLSSSATSPSLYHSITNSSQQRALTSSPQMPSSKSPSLYSSITNSISATDVTFSSSNALRRNS